jgi:hypothetical protein
VHAALSSNLGRGQRAQLGGDGADPGWQACLGGFKIQPEVAQWSMVRRSWWPSGHFPVLIEPSCGTFGEQLGPERAVLVVEVKPHEVVERCAPARLVPVRGLNGAEPQLLADVVAAVPVQAEHPGEPGGTMLDP